MHRQLRSPWADSGLMEDNAIIAGKYPAENGSRSGQRLERNYARFWHPLSHGERELTPIRADVDDGLQRAWKHATVLSTRENSMPQQSL